MLINKSRIPIKQIILYGLLPSFIKKIVFRLKGYKIGKNVSFALGSVIIGKDVIIEDNVSIGFLTVIRSKIIHLGRYVTIGSFDFIETEEFRIGEDSKIREHVYVAGLVTPDSKFILGKRCSILEYSFLNPTKSIIFGNDSGIGGCCQIFTHGSWPSVLEGYTATFEKVEIGNNVWIPWNVFILPGVSIGDNSVIGAGSVVSRKIPANCVASGNPIKIKVRNYPLPITDTEKKERLIQILNEFKEYLDYNGMSLELEKTDNNIHIYNKKHSLLFTFDSKIPIIEGQSNDNVLIFYNKNIKDNKHTDSFNMVISILYKERIGSSKIGEEFYSFLSRYGIRCNRLD